MLQLERIKVEQYLGRRSDFISSIVEDCIKAVQTFEALRGFSSLNWPWDSTTNCSQGYKHIWGTTLQILWSIDCIEPGLKGLKIGCWSKWIGAKSVHCFWSHEFKVFPIKANEWNWSIPKNGRGSNFLAYIFKSGLNYVNLTEGLWENNIEFMMEPKM